MTARQAPTAAGATARVARGPTAVGPTAALEPTAAPRAAQLEPQATQGPRAKAAPAAKAALAATVALAATPARRDGRRFRRRGRAAHRQARRRRMHVHHAGHDVLVQLESHDLVRRAAGRRGPLAPTSPRLARRCQFFALLAAAPRSAAPPRGCGANLTRSACSAEGSRRDYTLAP